MNIGELVNVRWDRVRLNVWASPYDDNNNTRLGHVNLFTGPMIVIEFASPFVAVFIPSLNVVGWISMGCVEEVSS